MGDDSDTEFDSGMMDPSPDQEGEAASSHGYDAAFFIVATLVAIGFIIALYYFKG